ncbi:histidine kinase [Psychrobacter sp. 2Y5]|uniref:histidine kinase n=1 Tax=Psychrobacter sp. 2Y5 TaxID=3453579 RepID=UPI003F48EEF7
MLAERLEFFVPKVMEMMTLWQWLQYILVWALFVTIVGRYELTTGTEFLVAYLTKCIHYILAIIPTLYLVDYLRPMFKRSNPIRVSLYIVLMFMLASTLSMLLVVLVLINAGWLAYDRQGLALELLFNMVFAGGFTLVFLLYFMRRHRELIALKQSFEHKLSAQNDLIKARLAPHFFFNTINSLLSLIESNPPHAARLLEHVSALFRASFNGAREISFEEEVALCEHYVAIESYRLADKLVVNWQLPDDEVMGDMVITALTLQSIIEKMLINVVEMTTETIYIDIAVVWQDHRVTITVSVQLPSKTLMIVHDLRQHVDFHVQAERLQIYFGPSSTINSTVTNTQIMTIIDYPLQDAGM